MPSAGLEIAREAQDMSVKGIPCRKLLKLDVSTCLAIGLATLGRTRLETHKCRVVRRTGSFTSVPLVDLEK